jgi:hypothetical protein
MNRTLFAGVIIFSAGVIAYFAAGGIIGILQNDQTNSAPFSPGSIATDTCEIKGTTGYLGLMIQFQEQGVVKKIQIPISVQIVKPDGSILRDRTSTGPMNSFFGSHPSGGYSVTITSMESSQNMVSDGNAIIIYNLGCSEREEYNMNQSLGAVMAIANLSYLVGFPVMIYGIVKQIRINRRAKMTRFDDTPIRLSSTVYDFRKQRPRGVTIIGVLSVIGGIYSIALAFIAFLLASLVIYTPSNTLDTFKEEVFGDLTPYAASQPQLGSLLLSFGAILLCLGTAEFVGAYGLLKGRRWAWRYSVILIFAGFLSDGAYFIVFSKLALTAEDIASSIIGAAISGVILYYLYRPSIKSFFEQV